MSSQDPKSGDKGVAVAEVLSGKKTPAQAAASVNRKNPKLKKKVTAAAVKRWVAAVRKALQNV
jgi:hypothetical protein